MPTQPGAILQEHEEEAQSLITAAATASPVVRLPIEYPGRSGAGGSDRLAPTAWPIAY